MFGLLKGNSKKAAKQRLKTVISRDRANVSAEFMLKLTSDIISAAVKYIEPDYEKISITVERGKNGAYLNARLPVVYYKEAAI